MMNQLCAESELCLFLHLNWRKIVVMDKPHMVHHNTENVCTYLKGIFKTFQTGNVLGTSILVRF